MTNDIFQNNSMTSRKKIVLIISATLLIVLVLLVYLRIKNNLEATTKQKQNTQTVELTSITKGSLINKLVYTGDIQAIQQANIYSRVAGNIEKIYADVGDFVHQGTLLAEIDKSTYLQAVNQTNALYDQANATLENNKTNFERNKELYDKGLLSVNDLDNARTTMNVSEAQVQSALATNRNSRIQLSYCEITAPFTGYITKRFLDRGSYVSVGGGQSQSSILFTISDIGFVKVIVNVLEKDVPLINGVQEANVSTQTYPDDVFTARIKKISQLIDVSTRTMTAEIDINNKDSKLKPGMFANIDIILKQSEAILLPSQCVLKDEKGDYVYQVGADSTVQKKYIQVGNQQDNQFEVNSGLEEGEKVIITGQSLVKEGNKVKIAK